jgi:Nucleotide modification associated domain 2
MYQQQFPSRCDAIYRLYGYEADGKEILTALRLDYHETAKERKRDKNGKRVLIFDPFWYWGSSHVKAPDEIADLAHYFVGQSAKNSSQEKIQLLENWAYSQNRPGCRGTPRDCKVGLLAT